MNSESIDSHLIRGSLAYLVSVLQTASRVHAKIVVVVVVVVYPRSELSTSVNHSSRTVDILSSNRTIMLTCSVESHLLRPAHLPLLE